jgi:hypothetical protein
MIFVTESILIIFSLEIYSCFNGINLKSKESVLSALSHWPMARGRVPTLGPFRRNVIILRPLSIENLVDIPLAISYTSVQRYGALIAPFFVNICGRLVWVPNVSP